jgi:hypothetical protein
MENNTVTVTKGQYIDTLVDGNRAQPFDTGEPRPILKERGYEHTSTGRNADGRITRPKTRRC